MRTERRDDITVVPITEKVKEGSLHNIHVVNRGGLGNQLFILFAALNLARYHSGQLMIDNASAFALDERYRRTSHLEHLDFPHNDWKIGVFLKFLTKLMVKFGIERVDLFSWTIIFQRDHKLIDLEGISNPKRNILLDGYWQSEKYFLKNSSEVIDILTKQVLVDVGKTVRGTLGIHFRCFDSNDYEKLPNVPFQYYEMALKKINMEEFDRVLVFGDNPNYSNWAVSRITFPSDTTVSFVQSDNPLDDISLLSRCEEIVSSNSTFGWWACWIGKHYGRTVTVPDIDISGEADWGFPGLIPDTWARGKC